MGNKTATPGDSALDNLYYLTDRLVNVQTIRDCLHLVTLVTRQNKSMSTGQACKLIEETLQKMVQADVSRALQIIDTQSGELHDNQTFRLAAVGELFGLLSDGDVTRVADARGMAKNLAQYGAQPGVKNQKRWRQAKASVWGTTGSLSLYRAPAALDELLTFVLSVLIEEIDSTFRLAQAPRPDTPQPQPTVPPALIAAEPAPTSPMARTYRRWFVAVALVGTTALGAAVGAVVTSNDAGGTDTQPSEGAEKVLPLRVNTSWPLMRGCDAATAVAMLPGHARVGDFSPERDPRTDIAATAGGGAWTMGFLYLNLVGTDDQPVQIFELKPVVKRTQLPSPAWVLGVQGGCGDSYERVFELNLDERSMTDRGIRGTPDDSAPPAEALGSAFTVTRQEAALVRLDALACRGNYEWSLSIRYFHNGVEDTQDFGPFRTMGKAKDTQSYTYTNLDDEMYFKKDGVISSGHGGPC